MYINEYLKTKTANNLYENLLSGLIKNSEFFAEKHATPIKSLFHNIPYLNKLESGISNISNKTLNTLGESMYSKQNKFKEALNNYNSNIDRIKNKLDDFYHLDEVKKNFQNHDDLKDHLYWHNKKIQAHEDIINFNLGLFDSEKDGRLKNSLGKQINKLKDQLDVLKNKNPIDEYYAGFSEQEIESLKPKDWNLINLARHGKDVAKNPSLINYEFINNKRTDYENDIGTYWKQMSTKDSFGKTPLIELKDASDDISNREKLVNRIGSLGTTGVLGGIGYGTYKGLSALRNRGANTLKDIALELPKAEQLMNEVQDIKPKSSLINNTMDWIKSNPGQSAALAAIPITAYGISQYNNR